MSHRISLKFISHRNRRPGLGWEYLWGFLSSSSVEVKIPFMEMWVSFLQSEFYHCFCLIYSEMSICTALINGAGLHSGAFYLSLDRNIRENNRQGWFLRSARSQTYTLWILCSNSNSNFNFGLPLSSWINECQNGSFDFQSFHTNQCTE